MKIGIIGAGVVGRTLGKLAVAVGHEVMLSNSRGPRTLFSLTRETGCAAGSVAEAAAFGELVVVAVPMHAWQDLPVAVLDGKVVIDTLNYYPERDGQIEALDRHAAGTSELVAAHLAGAHVVKAFNAIRMTDLEALARPAGDAARMALPVAGDDAQARRRVMALVEELGFDALDTGALVSGRYFEQGTPVYCVPMARAALQAALAAA